MTTLSASSPPSRVFAGTSDSRSTPKPRPTARASTAIAGPVATTASGKGVIAETHDWALGTCGNFGQSTANAYIGSADLVLAVGTRLGPADTTNENPALIDPARQTCVGLDINANHIRAARDGWVTGTARPIHIGKRSQVWGIEIEQDRPICIARLTISVVDQAGRQS